MGDIVAIAGAGKNIAANQVAAPINCKQGRRTVVVVCPEDAGMATTGRQTRRFLEFRVVEPTIGLNVPAPRGGAVGQAEKKGKWKEARNGGSLHIPATRKLSTT